MNSTTKTAAKFAEELNQSNKNSDKKGRHSTHKYQIRRARNAGEAKSFMVSV
jgi:hypothetical protein